MKMARFVLKIVGGALILAGTVCCIIGFWDKLIGLCPCKQQASFPSEFDDYADMD